MARRQEAPIPVWHGRTVLGAGRTAAVVLCCLLVAGCGATTARVGTGATVVDPPRTAAPQASHPASIAPGLDLSTYSVSDPSSRWVVVNKQRPLAPISYRPPDLTSVGSGQFLRADAAGALRRLVGAAAAAHLSIRAVSGYRSYSSQLSVHDRSVERNGDDADDSSARPGFSEHQIGWAVDVGGGGCDVEECFGSTAQGRWVAANGWRYGFVVRYPQGSQAITGYTYEPWHLRWVGVPLATYLHDRHIPTLEQVFGLPPAPSY